MSTSQSDSKNNKCDHDDDDRNFLDGFLFNQCILCVLCGNERLDDSFCYDVGFDKMMRLCKSVVECAIYNAKKGNEIKFGQNKRRTNEYYIKDLYETTYKAVKKDEEEEDKLWTWECCDEKVFNECENCSKCESWMCKCGYITDDISCDECDCMNPKMK